MASFYLLVAGTPEEVEFALSSRAFRKYKIEKAYGLEPRCRVALPDLPNYSLSLARWFAENEDDPATWVEPGTLVSYTEL